MCGACILPGDGGRSSMVLVSDHGGLSSFHSSVGEQSSPFAELSSWALALESVYSAHPKLI